jgi:Uma2 family endonuclease
MSHSHTAMPQLNAGQKLTREEFLRRWEAMPELNRAELIDGIVYMPSPLSDPHATNHTLLDMWIGYYAFSTPGCKAGNAGTWLMATTSAPQPDVALRIQPNFGGQSRAEGLYCAGAPELVVEICQTSATYDLGPKLALYQRAGVREYITFVLEPPRLLWRELFEGRYRTIEPDSRGILRSRVFPGLWLDTDAVLAGDGARVMKVLQEGLASAEHAEFVAELARRAAHH